jgi:hypothetical protein
VLLELGRVPAHSRLLNDLTTKQIGVCSDALLRLLLLSKEIPKWLAILLLHEIREPLIELRDDAALLPHVDLRVGLVHEVLLDLLREPQQLFVDGLELYGGGLRLVGLEGAQRVRVVL